MPIKGEEFERDESSSKAKEMSEYAKFLKQNKEEIEKIKQEFPQATKAGIKDLIFLLWMLDKNDKQIFSKARGLLKKLFVSGWVEALSAFKLAGDLLKK
jgi:hypothetical protein